MPILSFFCGVLTLLVVQDFAPIHCNAGKRIINHLPNHHQQVVCLPYVYDSQMGGLWHCFTHISRISQIHSGISQEIWFIYGNRLKKSQEYNEYGLLTLQSDPYHLHGLTEVSKAGVRSCEAWRSWWAMSSWDAEGEAGDYGGIILV